MDAERHEGVWPWDWVADWPGPCERCGARTVEAHGRARCTTCGHVSDE